MSLVADYWVNHSRLDVDLVGLLYERPIRGESPEAHFLAKLISVWICMKAGGFQVKLVDFMSESYKSDNSSKKLHFTERTGGYVI